MGVVQYLRTFLAIPLIFSTLSCSTKWREEEMKFQRINLAESKRLEAIAEKALAVAALGDGLPTLSLSERASMVYELTGGILGRDENRYSDYQFYVIAQGDVHAIGKHELRIGKLGSSYAPFLVSEEKLRGWIDSKTNKMARVTSP